MRTKRLAILFEANIYDRKGLVNAVINRARYIKKIADYTVDVYCLQGYPAGLNRFVRKKASRKRDNQVVIDGVTVHLLWFKCFLIDDFLGHRLNIKTIVNDWFVMDSVCKKLKDYDFISVHGFTKCVLRLNKEYGIPFSATWHGTDIHSVPYRSKYNKRLVLDILSKAKMNFFVSRHLLEQAQTLAGDIPAMVSYNGVNDSFVRFSISDREKLRIKFGVLKRKVVAFVGNLVHVKNVMELPVIFSDIKRKYKEDVVFWIIGDGYKREQLESATNNMGLDCRFWGDQAVEKMPSFYNSIDVLILPSKNEGLGMVLVEAIRCGANAVGSKVGGIPEVVGDENVFPLDDSFAEMISDRIAYMLSHNIVQTISPEFSWESSVSKENIVFDKYMYI